MPVSTVSTPKLPGSFPSHCAGKPQTVPPASHFVRVSHANQQLEQWIADVANKRELRQFKETPEQRFALEQEHLQPLPDTDFDTSYFDIRHVSWDSYIEVGGNRYSVPEALCGQPVSIRRNSFSAVNSYFVSVNGAPY